MTKDEQFKALLEWAGWTKVAGSHVWRSPTSTHHDKLPPLTLDLCHELWLRLCDYGIHSPSRLYCELDWIVRRDMPEQNVGLSNICNATADQRLEALARTLWPDKFKEKL
jgi:hypothetical protein